MMCIEINQKGEARAELCKVDQRNQSVLIDHVEECCVIRIVASHWDRYHHHRD
jgi:hypothetical protein